MTILGVDLSGPGNPAGTAVAVFELANGTLQYQTLVTSVDDGILYDHVASALASDDVCVGLDAPLSYGPTGGQRHSDRALRALAIKLGLPPGSVMAPTAPRMVYLTLRGLAVSRGLQLLGGQGELRIVETHPGVALALGGAEIEAIRALRDDLKARQYLLQWLTNNGLRRVGRNVQHTDHSVAASAAAWAAWRWLEGRSAWVMRADPPHHPFDFAC